MASGSNVHVAAHHGSSRTGSVNNSDNLLTLPVPKSPGQGRRQTVIGTPGGEQQNSPMQSVLNSTSSDDPIAEAMSRDPISSERLVAESLEAERLRRRLKFFFMNPYEKWKARKQFPWKLVLQIIKIILITVQLILFGSYRSDHIDYLTATKTAMRHIFLKGWPDTSDVVTYPPATGGFSVYTKKDFLDHLSHVLTQYYDLENISVIRFYKDNNEKGPNLCAYSWKNATVQRDVAKKTFQFDYDINEVRYCNRTLQCESILRNTSQSADRNMIDCFRLLGHNWPKMDKGLTYFKFTVDFDLWSVHVPPERVADMVSCYWMKVQIRFEDQEKSGQLKISLTNSADELTGSDCHGQMEPSNRSLIIGIDILDYVVMLICIGSFFLCARALLKGFLLKMKTDAYFNNVLKIPLEAEDRSKFVNLWYVMIVVNDVFILVGTWLKMSIDVSHFEEDVFTATTMFLGLGTLLVWCGVLRYLGFFAHYNVLMETMKRSFPNVLRFTFCAGLIYIGFLLCGWIVLGPYSLKFNTPLRASECLFSLINGDDMFATFFTIRDQKESVKTFGRIYLYVFISIFIYVVVSLFISIIMDAYEVIKEKYEKEETVCKVDRFIAECVDTPRPGNFDHTDSLCDACLQCACISSIFRKRKRLLVSSSAAKRVVACQDPMLQRQERVRNLSSGWSKVFHLDAGVALGKNMEIVDVVGDGDQSHNTMGMNDVGQGVLPGASRAALQETRMAVVMDPKTPYFQPAFLAAAFLSPQYTHAISGNPEYPQWGTASKNFVKILLDHFLSNNDDNQSEKPQPANTPHYKRNRLASMASSINNTQILSPSKEQMADSLLQKWSSLNFSTHDMKQTAMEFRAIKLNSQLGPLGSSCCKHPGRQQTLSACFQPVLWRWGSCDIL